MQKGIQLGEIHVPGSSGITGAKTFILTKPSENGRSVELLFGFFAADAPKRIVEKLSDRLAEEARPAFFSSAGDQEARFEAMLKQLNRAILGFLHEHELSIPGIRLRGAVGALINGDLMISNRGRLRGTLVIPQKSSRLGGAALQPFDLFDDAADVATNPKFFTGLQAGKLPPGSRLYVSTSELFEMLDETFVKETISGTDEDEAAKTLKSALKSTTATVSLISLSTPGGPELAAMKEAVPRNAPQPAQRRERPRPGRGPAKAGDMADVGEMVSRGIRAVFFGIGGALKLIPRLVVWLFRGLVRLFSGLPVAVRAIGGVFHPERRKLSWSAIAASHDRFVDTHVGRLNSMSPRARANALMIVMVGAILVHGTMFSFRGQASASESQAFQASLTEFEQLKTDLETTLIYANDARAKDVITRMKAVLDALPADNEDHIRAKQGVAASYEAALARFRKVVTLETPNVFASLEGSAETYRGGPMAVWDGTLYLFSKSQATALAFAVDGSYSEKEILKAPASAGAAPDGAGFINAAAGTTGLLLLGKDGTILYWNPKNDETQEYAGEVGTGPMMYWQNRLYGAADTGAIVRRALTADKLGEAVESVPAAERSALSSMAADGAVYLLSSNGKVEKFMKGAPVEEFQPAVLEPVTLTADHLWASPDYDRLVYVEDGGDRLIILEKKTGRLIGQYRSPALNGLEGLAVNPDTGIIYLLAGGKLHAVPMDLPKP